MVHGSATRRSRLQIRSHFESASELLLEQNIGRFRVRQEVRDTLISYDELLKDKIIIKIDKTKMMMPFQMDTFQ